jgi:L-lactate dehydrogenase (cytochrome)
MRLCGMTDLMRDASPDYLNTAELDPLVFGGRHPYARKVAKVKASL